MVRRITTSTISKSSAGAATHNAMRVEVRRGDDTLKGSVIFYPHRVSFHLFGSRELLTSL